MVTDIMKIIDSLNNNIEGINNSLKTILDPNGGVVIHDTFAPITTKVTAITTLGTTIVGAIIGTMFTMWLFKKQEKMRIRQELRLAFFKDYKVMYQKLLDLAEEFQTEVSITNNMNKYGQYVIEEEIINDKKILMYEDQQYITKNVIKVAKSLSDAMDKLDNYLESNELILEDYNGALFDVERAKITLIKSKIVFLEMNYSDIESKNNSLVIVSEKEINTLKKENKEYFDYILNLENQEETTKLLNLMKKTNSEIEKEFLGKYFKVKWYRKIIRLFKK